MKQYGYCRISRKTQDIERQVRNIQQAYPSAEIRCEVFTGTKVEGRQVLEKLMRDVRSGDTIIFDSVSRMSRNAEEGFTLYKDLMERGIELIFLKEPYVNTETYQQAMRTQLAAPSGIDDADAKELVSDFFVAINKYMLALAERQIRLAFDQAQKEVDDLRQRTKEGIETARLKGKQIGRMTGAVVVSRKEAAIKGLIKNYSSTFFGSNTDKDAIAIINSKPGLHVSPNTYYKYKRQLSESLGKS